MRILQYDRVKAYVYAKKWSYGRNPDFYNFDNIGGDCTNFASQCIYAGAGVMNYTSVFGWFYKTANDRTPSWTGVQYLYDFLVGNNGVGPFAEDAPLNRLEVGDIIQLGRATGDYYHSPVIVGIDRGNIYVAAHSYDAFGIPLDSYGFEQARGIHILGVRTTD